MTDPETPKPFTAVVPEKKSRERSPNYPAIGLRRAIDLAKAFWEHDRRQSVLAARAITNLGFGAKSSNGPLAISAMIKYGLLESEGSGDTRKVKLTESAITLLNPSALNRSQLMKEAALAPSIHAKLWQQFGSEGASEGAIHDYLVFELHFTEQAGKALIEQYLDTIAFANLLASDKIESEDKPKDPPYLPPNPGLEIQKEHAKASEAAAASVAARAAFTPPIDAFNPPLPQPPVGLMDFPVPLPSGIVAYYRLPPTITESDFNFYQTLLNAYRPGLVKNSQSFPCRAVWKNKDGDKPVTILGTMGAANGVAYYMSSDKTGIPETELEFQH